MTQVFVQCVDNINTMLHMTDDEARRLVRVVMDTKADGIFYVTTEDNTVHAFNKRNIVKITAPWPPAG